MADQKITALTADASPTGDDLIVTVQDPGGTPVNRKVTLANLATYLAGALTGLGASNISNRTRSVFMSASEFEQAEASAALTAGGIDIAPHWLLDAAAVESVVGTFIVPEDYATGDITAKVYFSMVSATSGNVVIHHRWLTVADGEDMTAGGTSAENTVAVPGTAGLLKIHSHTNTISGVAAGENVRVNIRRIGSDGADTATGDMRLYGVKLEYTADM